MKYLLMYGKGFGATCVLSMFIILLVGQKEKRLVFGGDADGACSKKIRGLLELIVSVEDYSKSQAQGVWRKCRFPRRLT